MEITLPWPPRELSPNRSVRLHWAKKMKAKQSYRDECFFLTNSQIIGKIESKEKIPVSIMFHPPRNSGDIDNMLAAAKAGLDAMAGALGVNDKQFRPITLDVGDKYPSGKIIITLLK